jgi:putative ABC transport system permease protein
VRYVGESLFRTLGVPLIRGRTLEARGEAAGFGEVVVSESLAAAVWPGEDPIGRTLHLDLFDGIDPTVVGTVRDIHLMDSRSAPRPTAYLSDEVVPSRTRDVILRARGDPESSILALRRALQKVDPQAPLYRVVTLPRLIAGAVSSDRFTTLLLLGFAILALVLSGVGVFGVISSDVGQRRREMAVRRALGALPTSLAAMLVRQALLRASLGVGVGAVLGLVLALSMRSLLFGVSPGDPWTFVGVSIGVEGVVVGATLLCAIPAVRRSPLATLREG